MLFDIYNIRISGSNSESYFWKFLPLFGTILGSYLGFYFGNKQAKRKEQDADERYFNFITQLIEDCERIGIVLVNRLNELKDNFDLSDNNSLKSPSLALLDKFEKSDQSRVFDVIYRHKEFSKLKPSKEINSSDVFDLISQISYISVGTLGINQLMEVNNKLISTLRAEFSRCADDLYSLVSNNNEVNKQILILNPDFNSEKKSSSSKKLLKPKQYIQIIVPAIENALLNSSIPENQIERVSFLVHKTKEIYSNIEQANKNTLSSESGGIVERIVHIEKAVISLKKFVDDFLIRKRKALSED